MAALTFQIKLLSPVLAQQAVSQEPNSASTHLYLPGSMIRGCLIHRLPASVRATLTDTHHTDWKALLLDGRARFLNAYPLHAETQKRMLPIPHSWRAAEKVVSGDDGLAYDAFLGPVEVKEKSKSFRGRFITPHLVQPQVYEPSVLSSAHNASDDRNRKNAQNSTVFRYDALAEGETFVAVVVGETSDLNRLLPYIEGDVLIGGSRTGGYGRATFFNAQIGPWEEVPTISTPPQKLDEIVVTLLSNAIIRGSDGQPSATLDGVLSDKALKVVSDMSIVGGFNRTWGLPLLQDWAIEAGSVFVYPRTPKIEATLHELQVSGVGERLGEGYGRIAVDWQVQHRIHISHALRAAPPTAAPLIVDSPSHQMAKRMADRQLQKQLERQLLKLVEQSQLYRAPRPAQLSRVRLAARQSLMNRDLAPLRQHLTSLFETRSKQLKDHSTPYQDKRFEGTTSKLKPGGQQLQQARIIIASSHNDSAAGPKSLLYWLREMSGMESGSPAAAQALWQSVLTEAEPVAGVMPTLDEALVAEYTARLIDGVLKQATRATQRERKQGGQA